MVYGASDLAALFADMGVPIQIGSDVTKGLVDRAGEEMLESAGAGALVSTAVVVTVATGSLPGLVPGATIIVDGTSMKVQERREIDDGALTKIFCVQAA